MIGRYYTQNQKSNRRPGEALMSYAPLDPDKKVCKTHPISTWTVGYPRCAQGYKSKEDCIELVAGHTDDHQTINVGDEDHNEEICIDCEKTE